MSQFLSDISTRPEQVFKLLENEIGEDIMDKTSLTEIIDYAWEITPKYASAISTRIIRKKFPNAIAQLALGAGKETNHPFTLSNWDGSIGTECVRWDTPKVVK